MIVNTAVDFFRVFCFTSAIGIIPSQGWLARAKKLLSFLFNIEPNAGDEWMDNTGLKKFDLKFVPRMERFHGLVEQGYASLQLFKTMTRGFT